MVCFRLLEFFFSLRDRINGDALVDVTLALGIGYLGLSASLGIGHLGFLVGLGGMGTIAVVAVTPTTGCCTGLIVVTRNFGITRTGAAFRVAAKAVTVRHRWAVATTTGDPPAPAVAASPFAAPAALAVSIAVAITTGHPSAKRKRAETATSTKKTSKTASDRDLPTGVCKKPHGKFKSMTRWGGKKCYI